MSAWYVSILAGVGATILSFLVTDYFFIEPLYQFIPSRQSTLHFSLVYDRRRFNQYLKEALARSLALLAATVEKLSVMTQRCELAAQHGKIGSQDYSAGEER